MGGRVEVSLLRLGVSLGSLGEFLRVTMGRLLLKRSLRLNSSQQQPHRMSVTQPSIEVDPSTINPGTLPLSLIYLDVEWRWEELDRLALQCWSLASCHLYLCPRSSDRNPRYCILTDIARLLCCCQSVLSLSLFIESFFHPSSLPLHLSGP